MRFVRLEVDERRYPGYKPEVAVEGRVLLNRFDVALFRAWRAVNAWWWEHPVGWFGRLNCRCRRRHNVTCRSRSDHHILGVGLVDPDRWHYRPHG